jgi:hypothetical protein
MGAFSVGRARLGLVVLVLACLAPALMTACGSSGSGSTTTTPQTPASLEPSSSTQAEPSPQPVADGSGPVLGEFTVGEATAGLHLDSLRVVDVANGESETIFTNQADSEAATTLPLGGDLHLAGWYMQQLFDPALKRMALNWAVAADGSHHVGWIDSDGVLTDVSQQLSDSGSDFAALPQDGNALFDNEGDFVYVDEAKGLLHRLDPDSLQAVGKSQDVTDQANPWDPLMLQPDGSLDGTSPDRLFDPHYVVDVRMPGKDTIVSFGDYAVEDLVDESHVLVRTPKGLAVMGPDTLKRTVEDATYKNEYDTETGSKVPTITPATDWTIETAAISGDGSQVAFVASRGTSRALFVMPADGSAEPRKLEDLGPTTRLMFWR